MAENEHMFDNDDVFTKNNEIDTTVKLNDSETLATQGNVINSLKIFWARLRAKLKYAVTRSKLDTAVGGNYQPIFVNETGGVQVCVPTTITGEVVQRNISLDEIASPYPGQIVCIKVTKTNTTSNNSTLTIKGKQVYYPTNVAVTVSDVIDNTYLFTYISGDGDKWILNNKINVVSTNNSGLMTADQCSKLENIAPNANNYILPTADVNTTGGVRLGYTTNNNQKNYGVQKDNNDNLFVNVPWTDNNTHLRADLKVGTVNSQNNDNTSSTQETYIKIVENSIVRDAVKVVGKTGITISSSNSGELEINGVEYPILGSSQYFSSTGYRVRGPGQNKNTTSYYLAGNGTWQIGILVPIPTEEGKTLKSHSNGTVYWG